MQARYVIGAGVLLGAFAVVSVVAYFANQELYLTVDELVADPALYARGAEASVAAVSAADASAAERTHVEGPATAGPNGTDGTYGRRASASMADPSSRRLQVRGDVDYDSVVRPAEGLELRFDLVGKDGRLPVVYEGLVPDTFDMAESVTVAGRLASDGTFVADDLVVQCPSKYEAVPPGATVPHTNG